MATADRAWRRAERRGGRPLILGHRGASARAPENSVEAFRRAAADGADGVELDVLPCATGEAVVFHDDDLRRLADRPDRVVDLGLPDLRLVRLASGARIPTLEEAFEACGPDLLVNVELKTSRLLDRRLPDLVRSVAAVIDRLGAGERVVVSSFNPFAVALWKRRAPAVRAALLLGSGGPMPLRRAWPAQLLRPYAIHPECGLCTRERVALWHEAGYAIGTWTVDDPERVRALAAMGVDAIISNDPAAARAALEVSVPAA